MQTPADIYIYIYILVGLAILCSFLVNGFGDNISVYADNVKYSVTVEPSLSISISSSDVTLNINPAVSQFASQDLTVKVGTNNSYGYKLYINADTTNLVKTDDNNAYIENITTETDQDHFPTNYWGYKVNSNVLNHTNYNPFTSGTLISESSTATNEQLSTLTFAAKANLDKPAGSYKLDLEFKALPIVTTYTMQELGNDTELANTICTETPTVVSDNRDGQMYVIARLKDGNCWMISNVNLAGGTKLYSDSSDVPNGYDMADGVAYYTLPESSSAGFNNDTIHYVYNSNNITANQSDCTSSLPCDSYYSWLTATAGGKDISGNSATSNGGDAAYSVCPKGWKLPSSGNNTDTSISSVSGYKKGDYYKLATAYSVNLDASYYTYSSIFYNNAGPGTSPNFLLAGNYYNNVFAYGGSSGYYWTSSSRSNTEAYAFGFTTSYTTAGSYYFYRYGFPVRCKLQNPLEKAKTMQNLTSADVAKATDGMTAVLTDTRDNQQYGVAKINDKVWMTKNLNIAGGTKLTSEKSNVTTDYTLPNSSTSGWTSDSAQYLYNSNSTTCNSNSPCYSYYSYVTANASNNPSGAGDPNQDICPAGWRIPSQDEFLILIADYNTGAKITTTPFLGVYAGHYYQNVFYSGGTEGAYWSSTESPLGAYRMAFSDSTAGMSNSRKRGGFSVRCISK